MQVPAEDSEWEEEEEEEEVSASENEQESQELAKSSECSSEDEAKESKQEAASRKAMIKRKRKQVETKKVIVKKPRSLLKKDGSSKKEERPIIEEKSHSEVGDTNGSKPGKKEPQLFNDKNVDIDLHNSPESIISRRIRLNANYILTCRTNIYNTQDGAAIEYASIVFQKKGKEGKLNESYVPLELAPKIIAGLKEIMKENPKYFTTYIN